MRRSLLLLAASVFVAGCAANDPSSDDDFVPESVDGVRVFTPTDDDDLAADVDLVEDRVAEGVKHFVADVDEGGIVAEGAKSTPVIDVDESTHFQSIVGFGASLTDASAYLLEGLSPNARANVMRRLFDRHSGIGLSVLRQSIGSNDETPHGRYSWDDGAPDPTLSRFGVPHDEAKYVIPALKEALSIAPNLWLMASPWSPPGWMKNNGSMINPCALASDGSCAERHGTSRLLPQYYAAYAQYLVRFFDAYAQHGIHFSAMTLQNEPEQFTFHRGNPNTDGYPGMHFDEDEEANFVANFLAPAMRDAGFGGVSILGYDFNWHYERDYATGYSGKLLDDPRVKPLLGGLAFHCYGGDPSSMTLLQRLHPDMPMYVTECTSSNHQSPSHAIEKLISSMRHQARTFIAFNVAIGKNGEPHQGHGCDGCIGVVEIDGQNVRRTHDFGWLGLASKFVERNAVRIRSCPSVPIAGENDSVGAAECGHQKSDGIENVAFRNPNGHRVLVTFNSNSHAVDFVVRWRGRRFKHHLDAGKGATFVW